MYMDPEPTVALNNREAMLSGQEEEEEARILAALSSAVAAQSARIWQVGHPTDPVAQIAQAARIWQVGHAWILP